MLTVDTIGRIRREHFLKGKTIKEIARDLSVSRNTVRKVLRSGETSFEYGRDVQPRPKLGRWTVDLDELLDGNAVKSAREQLTLIRIFEELRRRGYEGGYDAVRRYARRWSRGARAIDGRGLCAAELCAGRSLSVRLEPRDRPAERRDGDRESRPCPALPQPHAVRAGLSARDAGDGVRRSRPGLRHVQGRLRSRHLRQHEDGGGDDPRRQGASLQSPLSADVQPLPRRSGGLHAGLGLGEGTGREPGRARARALLHTTAAVQDPRRAERLVARSMHRLRQGAPPSRAARTDDLGGVRGGTAEACSLCRSLRRIPCGAGLGLQDLPGALRQQQVLGGRQRGRAARRSSCLCRPYRHPPGRPYCR